MSKLEFRVGVYEQGKYAEDPAWRAFIGQSRRVRAEQVRGEATRRAQWPQDYRKDGIGSSEEKTQRMRRSA